MSEVKQLDAMVTEIGCHGTRITDIREGASDNNAIKAGKYAGYVVLVTLDERIHDVYPLF